MIGNIRTNMGFMRLLVLATVVFGGGCSRMDDKQLTVGKITYNFPASHIFRFTNPGEGHPFARIRPPGQKYDLVYSEFSKFRRNFQGHNVPLVTGINDRSASPTFKEFNFPDGKTVCRLDQPYYSCGLNINDDGVTWSVIFNSDQVSESDSIRKSALEALRMYRS